VLVEALLAALAGGVACTLRDANVVELQSTELQIKDVVQLECAPADERDRLGVLVIATLPTRERATALTRRGVAALVRRRAPRLSVEPSGEGEILFRRAVTSVAPSPTCFAATHALDGGAIVTDADVVEAPCTSVPQGRVTYDRADGVTRARVDIAANEALGAIMPSPTNTVDANEQLSLVFSIGHVQVERSVRALQPGAGENLFVRDNDGRVFSAPSPRASPQTSPQGDAP
jgi:flagella basal body P-ring formation protein FlgA